MSTKKQARRQRRMAGQEGKRAKKLNPVTLFMVSIGAALLIVGTAAFFLREDHGPPPYPGATWSEGHPGEMYPHWH